MKPILTLCGLFMAFCSVAKEGVGLKQAETFQNKSSLAFIENKGQIVDQNGKHRKDIDFKLEAGGMTMFVGSAAIHYQWARPGEVSSANLPRPAATPSEGQLSDWNHKDVSKHLTLDKTT